MTDPRNTSNRPPVDYSSISVGFDGLDGARTMLTDVSDPQLLCLRDCVAWAIADRRKQYASKLQTLIDASAGLNNVPAGAQSLRMPAPTPPTRRKYRRHSTGSRKSAQRRKDWDNFFAKNASSPISRDRLRAAHAAEAADPSSPLRGTAHTALLNAIQGRMKAGLLKATGPVGARVYQWHAPTVTDASGTKTIESTILELLKAGPMKSSALVEHVIRVRPARRSSVLTTLSILRRLGRVTSDRLRPATFSYNDAAGASA